MTAKLWPVPERAAAGRKGFGLMVSVGSIPSFVPRSFFLADRKQSDKRVQEEVRVR